MIVAMDKIQIIYHIQSQNTVPLNIFLRMLIYLHIGYVPIRKIKFGLIFFFKDTLKK